MDFENLSKFWDDMVSIIKREGLWPDFRLNEYKEKFMENITGRTMKPVLRSDM